MQIHPGDWFASVDLKDTYFHIQIGLHHRHFLRFAFKGNSVPILCSLVQAGFGPTHFFEVHRCSTPPSERAGCAFYTFWTIGMDLLLIHLESLGLRVNMQKSILAPSQSMTYLGACLDSMEMRARLSRECMVAILSSLRHFRQGSSVHLKEFQRLRGLMASASVVCHLGLLHMRPLQLWLRS